MSNGLRAQECVCFLSLYGDLNSIIFSSGLFWRYYGEGTWALMIHLGFESDKIIWESKGKGKSMCH